MSKTTQKAATAVVRMMKAMNQEIILRKDYLENDKEIESIYYNMIK